MHPCNFWLLLCCWKPARQRILSESPGLQLGAHAQPSTYRTEMDGTMADLLAPPPYLHSKAQMKAANVSEEGQESAVRAML